MKHHNCNRLQSMAWFKWVIIWCSLLYLSDAGESIFQLTFDPLVTSQISVTGNRIYSCATVSLADGLIHTYHHFFAAGTIYRFDELDQILYTFNLSYNWTEIECGINSIRVLSDTALSALTVMIFEENGAADIQTPTNNDVVTNLKAVYFGNQRVFFVSAQPSVSGASPYSYYSYSNATLVTLQALLPKYTTQFLAANVLAEQLTAVTVTLDNDVISANAITPDLLYTFQETLGVTVNPASLEIFWYPPAYYITFEIGAGQYAIFYKKEFDLTPVVFDFYDSYIVKNIQFRSDGYPFWNGALFSLQASLTGNYLYGFIRGTLIVNQTLSQFDPIIVDGTRAQYIMSMDQLDNSSFVMTQWNGISLKSLVVRVGDNIQITPPIANNPSPSTEVILFNSSTTVTTLSLTNNSVLVVTNEAVIEVTNCAELAGKLQYILSQNQYNTLLQNDTLNILVLLTQCTNGSFDLTEVLFEGVDDACLDFNGEPIKSPGQLTLLVTKSQGDCNSNVVQDPLTTGAIIGIVVGCAAAVVLIIILALYFSPVSAKVFPYAAKNKK